MTAIDDILRQMQPITLEQMSGVKLMNRSDTKFITTEARLLQLLSLARSHYYVQDIDGIKVGRYRTLYYDTTRHEMYLAHLHGHAGRQKIRVRHYMDSALSFLEVKTKNNHGRTRKKRVAVDHHAAIAAATEAARRDLIVDNKDFVCSKLHYAPETLTGHLNNEFERITLVNTAMTERLTIDRALRFDNILTGNRFDLSGLVIIELKRDGLKPSPILALLRELRIMPHGFSKYCMGMAFTSPREALPQGRFKERLRYALKMLDTQ